MRDMVANLIKYDGYTKDDDGNQIPRKEKKEVFANLRSVGQNEFFKASQQGLKPTIVLLIFEYDYDGERVAEIDGKEYTIYRTQITHKRGMVESSLKGEVIELYCEERIGNDS